MNNDKSWKSLPNKNVRSIKLTIDSLWPENFLTYIIVFHATFPNLTTFEIKHCDGFPKRGVVSV